MTMRVLRTRNASRDQSFRALWDQAPVGLRRESERYEIQQEGLNSIGPVGGGTAAFVVNGGFFTYAAAYLPPAPGTYQFKLTFTVRRLFDDPFPPTIIASDSIRIVFPTSTVADEFGEFVSGGTNLTALNDEPAILVLDSGNLLNASASPYWQETVTVTRTLNANQIVTPLSRWFAAEPDFISVLEMFTYWEITYIP